MIRFGILGAARIARAFFREPLEGVEIRAVASRDKSNAEAFAAEFGIPKSYQGYEALLADPEIDAVYIPLPQHLHAEYTIKAAQAGKHVLVEKPAALNSAEVKKMTAACRKHDVLYMEAFMYRFLRIHNRAKEIIAEGTIGELRHIDYHLSFNAWARGLEGFRLHKETGGGALYDLGIYAADFLRFITDSEPKLVKAYMRRAKPDGVDLFTHAVYTIDKIIATVSCGFNCDANYYTLAGERGSIHAPVALSGRPDQHSLLLHFHKDNSRKEEVFPPESPFKFEIEYFARCIERNEQPFLDAANSLKNAQLLDELFKRAEPI